MAVQVSYPGVYIEEFAPGAPIQGVGTSTAAFIGVAAGGVLNQPTKLTNWDQFKALYGPDPVPGFYLWYAVRGFFENGGNVCYAVRASNGAYANLDLVDSGGGAPLITVRSRQPGDPVNAINVAVDPVHLLSAANTSLFQPTGTLLAVPAGREITLNANQAFRFRPGDIITIAALGERAEVVRVSGDVLSLDRNLSGVYAANDPVRLADLVAGARELRIASAVALPTIDTPVGPVSALTAGSMLTITQGGTSATGIVEAVQTEHLDPANVTWRVTFRTGLGAAFDMSAAASVESQEFRLTVNQGNNTVYDNLSVDAVHPRYYIDVVNGDAGGLVHLSAVEPPPPEAPPLNLPATLAATDLANGADEVLAALNDNHFMTALDTLRGIDDVNVIAVPDRITPAVQQAVITHCEQLMDRFGVLDAGGGLAPFGANSIETQRSGVDSARGYAGLYYPWLRILPEGSGPPILVPPSGHICGIFARSDSLRGVHKAPANEIIGGTLGVERRLGLIDQGQLNLQGINVVQVFQDGGRPILWGARTTATDRNWQYVNIRRLFLYLEESIQEGIRWAVFEPNNLQLWQKLKRSIGDFLNRAWRDGALFGATAKEAYYVRIDEILNPFSSQQLGHLRMQIGVRPTYTTEFIVVQIGIWDGGSEMSEG